MAFTYGFYNSKNNDRQYDAEQFSSFLDGIVYDGVYQAVGDNFMVKATEPESMTITVGSGRAWFDHTWTLNTMDYPLTLDDPDTVYDRIDAIVLEVNKVDRRNYLKIVKGTPAEIPQRPTLIKCQDADNFIMQYAIAFITVYNNDNIIHQSNIYYFVGKENNETPLCSALALSGIPSGGNTGDVLAKSSNESGAINWYHPDHLPYNSWMYVSGITSDDVIAAWKFKGAENKAVALTNCNISTSTYTLAASGDQVTWSAKDGIFIPGIKGHVGLINNDVKGSSIGTVVIKYANAEVGNNYVGLFEKDQRFVLAAKMAYDYTIDPNDELHGTTTKYPKRPGMKFDPNAAVNYMYSNYLYFTYTIEEEPTSGVISYNASGEDPVLFFNKEKCALSRDPDMLSAMGGASTYKDIPGHESGDILIGHNGSTSSSITDNMFGSVYIHAVIVFNRILTDTETVRVHEAMMTL